MQPPISESNYGMASGNGEGWDARDRRPAEHAVLGNPHLHTRARSDCITENADTDYTYSIHRL